MGVVSGKENGAITPLCLFIFALGNKSCGGIHFDKALWLETGAGQGKYSPKVSNAVLGK